TAERFVKASFLSDEVIYNTGDLACRLPNGDIKFLGRRDFQVKLRGFRIELGEIEKVLMKYPDITEAVVTVRGSDPQQQYLAAYFTLVKGVEDSREIRLAVMAHMKKILPYYMWPNTYTRLDEFPRTSSDKVDRKLLPVPDTSQQVAAEYVAPSTAREIQLAEIWQTKLGRDKIGIDDDFFNLGGNSTIAMEIVPVMNKALGLSEAHLISVTQLFSYPTIRELASDAFAKDELIDLSKEAVLDPDIFIRDAGLPVQASPQHVFLTGSTGFLGKYLLAELLQKTEATIHCLVRGDDAAAAFKRLQDSMVAYGLWDESYGARIILVLGDISLPRFGLSLDQFNALSATIDVIYHNAVAMNHVAPYKTLEAANVRGTEEILRLACTTKPKPVHYVSTAGVFSETGKTEPVEITEQTPIKSERHYHSSGYAGTKWVAEKLVLLARDRGIECNIYRLGLVIGDSKTGKYAENQWLAKLIESCHLLGAIPADFGMPMHIVTVDDAAKMIVGLSQSSPRNGNYHVFSREPVTAGEILALYNRQFLLRTMSAYDWLQLVNQSEQELPIKHFIGDYLKLTSDEISRKIATGNMHRFSCERTNAALPHGFNFSVLSDAVDTCFAANKRLAVSALQQAPLAKFFSAPKAKTIIGIIGDQQYPFEICATSMSDQVGDVNVCGINVLPVHSPEELYGKIRTLLEDETHFSMLMAIAQDLPDILVGSAVDDPEAIDIIKLDDIVLDDQIREQVREIVQTFYAAKGKDDLDFDIIQQLQERRLLHQICIDYLSYLARGNHRISAGIMVAFMISQGKNIRVWRNEADSGRGDQLHCLVMREWLAQPYEPEAPFLNVLYDGINHFELLLPAEESQLTAANMSEQISRLCREFAMQQHISDSGALSRLQLGPAGRQSV
ncbi:MAG: thioester reductase domain-containing protein, partial [Gammaproteobacteria bacterium]|nr:thioester reductase domain-containing protein [Gammaproteobacteria bacterium]